MAGKASLPKTPIDDTVSLNKARKKQFGRERAAYAKVQTGAGPIGVSFAGTGNNISTTDAVLTSGGTPMIGPLAFHPKAIMISSDTIDISRATGTGFSSRVSITGQTTADDLKQIDGANNAGQILFLQSITGQTITLKHHTGSSGGGNINIPGGADYVMGAQDIVLLQWDTINPAYSGSGGQWTLVSSSSSSSGATRELDNLQNTAVNVHLLPTTSGNKNLGSTTKEWATLYLSSGLYFGTDQNSSTLNHSDGLLFNITDTNDWYEFQIGSNRKLSVKSSVTVLDGDFDPETADTHDLGDSTYYWRDLYIAGDIHFKEGDDAEIKKVSTGLEYEIATGDYHRFQVNNVTKFQVGGSSCSLDGGMFIGSADGVEVGYKVNNQALTVGSQGSMIHPYISNTDNNPTNSDLDGWFGDQNGALGIQYYSTTGQHRIWIRSNGTWVKTFGT